MEEIEKLKVESEDLKVDGNVEEPVAFSRLSMLKEQNPLYTNSNDEQILASSHNQYYKNQLTFDDYKKQMLEPMTPLIQNKIANERYMSSQNISNRDIANQILKNKGEKTAYEGFFANEPTDT
jgi:hypothetical protein